MVRLLVLLFTPQNHLNFVHLRVNGSHGAILQLLGGRQVLNQIIQPFDEDIFAILSKVLLTWRRFRETSSDRGRELPVENREMANS
jgi:hypothetical protein